MFCRAWWRTDSLWAGPRRPLLAPLPTYAHATRMSAHGGQAVGKQMSPMTGSDPKSDMASWTGARIVFSNDSFYVGHV
jgi:hypothetical protein